MIILIFILIYKTIPLFDQNYMHMYIQDIQVETQPKRTPKHAKRLLLHP